ncbi:DUF1768-domain-containing protein [Nemania sp. NC0429]|nr:DUF1768-domain-containing protein [Nemania sp. NC0429]
MPPKTQGVGKGKAKGKRAPTRKSTSKPAAPTPSSSTALPPSSFLTPTATADPDPTGPIYFWRPQEPETGFLSQWYALPFRGRRAANGGGVINEKGKEEGKEGEEGEEDKVYATAEHYMMHHKALLFGDAEMAAAILEASSPRDVKALGRAVRGFDQAVWGRERARIVVEGNWCKFSLPVVSPPVFHPSGGEGEGEHRTSARQEGGEKGPVPAPGLRTWKLGNAEHAAVIRGASFRDALLATGDRELVEASPRDRIWGVGFGARNAPANRNRWGLNLLGKCLMEVREQFRKEEAEAEAAMTG